MNQSKVYFGSINHGQTTQFASLANKLDKIIENLDFSTLTKKDKVAVKMHLGYTDGAQTIPSFYVRRVVEKIKETKVKVVGMSALLTTTMPGMEKTIKALKEAGVSAKIMVGGAPVTQSYADRIGADGYAPDAASAVDLAKGLVS